MDPSQNDKRNIIKINTINIVIQSPQRERGMKQIYLNSQIV